MAETARETVPETVGSTGSGPAEIYWQNLADGRFLIQRCNDCGRHVFYPRAICPHCGSADLDFVTPSGRGTVYATSVVRRRAEQGGDHNVALVDLDEGPRLITRVEDVAPEAVTIGMIVAARVNQTDDGPVLVFVPAGGAS